MERNHSLDILKFILAYEVVMLHCCQAPYIIVRPIVDSAVPCFFMISGYLIYSEIVDYYRDKLKRGIIKIALILLWSSLLCGVNDIYKLIVFHDIGNFTIISLYDFILFNENPFAFHLWYISAYLYTLVFYFVLVRKHVSIRISWIMGIWLAGIILIVSYIIFYHENIRFIYVRNFLFQGIPFFGWGMILKMYKNYFVQFRTCHIAISLLLMILLAILLKSIESYSIETFLFSGIIAFFILILFTRIHIDHECYISMIGKEDGLYIYIFHPFVMIILKNDYLMYLFGYNPYLFSSVVFIITVVAIRLARITYRKLFCCKCLPFK